MGREKVKLNEYIKQLRATRFPSKRKQKERKEIKRDKQK